MSKKNFREKLLDYYCHNGFRIGKIMMIDTAIVSVGVLLLVVFAKFGFSNSLAMIIAIPMLSLCVDLTRLATLLIFMILNFRSVVIRTLISLFVFVFVGLAFSSVFTLFETVSEIVSIIIFVLFDVVYVGVIVLLLYSNRFKTRKMDCPDEKSKSEKV